SLTSMRPERSRLSARLTAETTATTTILAVVVMARGSAPGARAGAPGASSAPLALAHVRGRRAREEVFARRREHVEDLRGLRERRLVLDATGDDRDRPGAAHASLGAEPEVHAAGEDPERLLVRMSVRGGVGPCLHRPPHDHSLLAREHAAGDLVRQLFFREV